MRKREEKISMLLKKTFFTNLPFYLENSENSVTYYLVFFCIKMCHILCEFFHFKSLLFKLLIKIRTKFTLPLGQLLKRRAEEESTLSFLRWMSVKVV